jgi:hypothetical protein
MEDKHDTIVHVDSQGPVKILDQGQKWKELASSRSGGRWQSRVFVECSDWIVVVPHLHRLSVK